MKPRAAINTNRHVWEWAYGESVRCRIHELVDFDEDSVPEENSEDSLVDRIGNAQVVLSSWHAVPYTERVLAACPDLKLVLYAAGSVKHFVTPELQAAGVTICSAVHLNARPVAEFVLGLILTSLKRVYAFKNETATREREVWRELVKSGISGGNDRT